jgi:4'-phosphopantetheinyl transferase
LPSCGRPVFEIFVFRQQLVLLGRHPILGNGDKLFRPKWKHSLPSFRLLDSRFAAGDRSVFGADDVSARDRVEIVYSRHRLHVTGHRFGMSKWRDTRMIPAGEIHVWHASTERSGKEAEDYLSLLSPEEQRRAQSFRFERDRATYVLGRGMLRTLLGNLLDVPPSAIEFTCGRYGKPAIAVSCGLAFNLAHAGAQVVCALAADREVGVDIERERTDRDLMGLARRYFCAKEISQLEQSPPEAKGPLFYKYWTLKEAYLKAEGSGLSMSLKAIDASGIADSTAAGPHPPEEDAPRGILVQRLAAPPGYAAAVAAKGGIWMTRIHNGRAGESLF